MICTRRNLTQLAQVIVFVMVTATVFGQTAPAKSLRDSELVELLQSRLKQVDDLRDLDDAAKGKVKELYQKALGEIEAATRWAAEGAHFDEQAKNAPKELEQTKRELSQAAERSPSP